MSSLPEAHPPADRKPARGRPFELQPTWRMSLWHGAIVAGLLFLAYIFLVVAPREGIFGMDAWCLLVRGPAGRLRHPTYRARHVPLLAARGTRGGPVRCRVVGDVHLALDGAAGGRRSSSWVGSGT